MGGDSHCCIKFMVGVQVGALFMVDVDAMTTHVASAVDNQVF